MKKILLALGIFMLFCTRVEALPDIACRPDQMNQGRNDLVNVTFNLQYAENAVDMNGDFLESQYFLTIPNLPEGYIAFVTSPEGASYIGNASEYALVTGGVSTIEYYSTSCNTLIKKAEFMAPFYKVYCEIEGNCEKDVWFDGTYENTASNQNRDNRGKINMRLVVILVILIIIIVLFIAVIIKRRKSYEAGL